MRDLKYLARHAEQRGRDSSGLFAYQDATYRVMRADYPITRLIREWSSKRPQLLGIVMGHSRLITNGMSDNQPVMREDVCVLHNGIIVNDAQVWNEIRRERQLQVLSLIHI